MTADETARLVRRAEKNVEDAQGWALDLLDVLQSHQLEQSRENVCAAIAVINQESGFVADPLFRAWASCRKMPCARSSAEFRWRVVSCCAGWNAIPRRRQVSWPASARPAPSTTLIAPTGRWSRAHASEKSGLTEVVQLGLLNRIIEERNEIDTAGSMQVSVKFSLEMAKRRRWLPMMLDDVYAVRDQLYTRHGGMYYGVPQLLGYETGYARKVYRFADYNAGRYASRNAALQQVIGTLSGEKLALDGDLLSYAKSGKAISGTTGTERAIRKISAAMALGLSNSAIRNDLLHEKNADFVSTTDVHVAARGLCPQDRQAAPVCPHYRDQAFQPEDPPHDDNTDIRGKRRQALPGVHGAITFLKLQLDPGIGRVDERPQVRHSLHRLLRDHQFIRARHHVVGRDAVGMADIAIADGPPDRIAVAAAGEVSGKLAVAQIVSRPTRTMSSRVVVKPVSIFRSGWLALASRALRPMKSVPSFSFTAQPSPASNGVSLGVMSDDQARYAFSRRSNSRAR